MKKCILFTLVAVSVFGLVFSKCDIDTATPRFRKAIFDFSVDIIKKLSIEEDNNFAVSPLTIWMLIATIAEGASGNTYNEIKKSLHLNKHPCFQSKYFELLKELTGNSDATTFERSGIIVVDDQLRVRDEFQLKVNELELVTVSDIDFSDVSSVAQYINEYVETATYGNVKDVVHDKDIESDRMIAIDAVYFNALWNFTIDPNLIAVNDFFDDNENMIGSVNLMKISGSFYFTRMDNIKANILELPYGLDDRFAMLIFLPTDRVPLHFVIDSLDLITLNAVYRNFEKAGKTPLKVHLPRFTMRSSYDSLKKTLSDLGIKSLFEFGAEIQGIVDTPHFVNEFKHKAIIELNEKGQPESFTSIFTNWLSPPAETFSETVEINKPFLYLIVEKYTHTIVFAGAFSKPNIE